MAEGSEVNISNDFYWGALKENFAEELRTLKKQDTVRENRRSKRKRKTPAKTPYVRKNRPFKRPSLECCNENCLHKNGGHLVMRTRRMDFHQKLYEEQNLMLLNLIKAINPTVQCEDDNNASRKKRRRYVYHLIDDNAEKTPVCRTAFLKTFGISVKRVKTVLKKVMPYKAGLKPDYRGRHHNHLKVSQDLKNQIYEFVTENFKSEESHYCRERNNKRFITPTVSKSGMWRKFEEHCRHHEVINAKYTRSRKRTKHFISRKKFLEIVLDEFNFSFRKLRKDTCDSCDKFKATLARTRNTADRRKLEEQHEAHLERANSRYLMHDFDFLILSKAHGTHDWVVPPRWIDESVTNDL